MYALKQSAGAISLCCPKGFYRCCRLLVHPLMSVLGYEQAFDLMS
jgi:hypothetical protein